MNTTKNNLDDLRIDRSGVRREKSRAGWILIIVLLLVLAGAGIWWFQRPQAPEVSTFVVRATTTGGQQTLLNASGYVTARREATVSSKVTGKVVEVLVEEGLAVEEGQILARLDSSNVEKSLNLAKAQSESARKSLDETKANLNQAERDLERVIKLASDQIASQSELDAVEAAAKSLQARLARQLADVTVTEQEVALWQQQMEDNIIRAPFSGIVTSKNAQPGEMISPVSAGGGFTRTGICTIVDMDSLEIEVDVNESYINRVRKDQPVTATLDSYPTWEIPASVIAIIPTADRQKATVKVRVGFLELDSRILPEMSVKVAFKSGENTGPVTQSILIPKSALDRKEGREVVWVVRDNKVERRAVTVGPVLGDEATILAGVNNGERLVLESPENLQDGTRVIVIKP